MLERATALKSKRLSKTLGVGATRVRPRRRHARKTPVLKYRKPESTIIVATVATEPSRSALDFDAGSHHAPINASQCQVFARGTHRDRMTFGLKRLNQGTTCSSMNIWLHFAIANDHAEPRVAATRYHGQRGLAGSQRAVRRLLCPATSHRPLHSSHSRSNASQNPAIKPRCEVVEDAVVAWQVANEKTGAEPDERTDQHGMSPDPIWLLRALLLNLQMRHFDGRR